MKKLSVIVALALLAVAGTGFAVTCAYDNVPGATLLVPYFRVGGTVNSAGIITTVGTDTKIAFVNVSYPGIIAHVTVWNKYSRPVLDFNVPMTGKDVVSFNMSSVLNGSLNVNPLTQVTPTKDVCGVVLGSPTTYNATPFIGWAQTQYLRFAHPLSTSGTQNDWPYAVSKYNPGDAFSLFRTTVMQSLDESGDITEFQASTGAFIVDVDNPACGKGTAGQTYTQSGEFSGYLTIDVVNFCTNWFPNQKEFYQYDAIATTGWGLYGYSPNVLMGDVFYVDQTAGSGGNISGDPAVALEFDTRLDWINNANPGPGTFFGRFVQSLFPSADPERNGGVSAGNPAVPAVFVFGGDGREPLGDHWGWRFLANTTPNLRTWMLVWRGDVYLKSGVDLCYWMGSTNKGASGDGFYDTNHQLNWTTWDEDEDSYSSPQSGGPSGYQPPNYYNYIFLESQRIALWMASTSTANMEIIPGWGNTALSPNGWSAGWMDFFFRNGGAGTGYQSIYNQAWVGVQHSGPGALLSVGLSATNLNGNFQCNPPQVFGTTPGVQP